MSGRLSSEQADGGAQELADFREIPGVGAHPPAQRQVGVFVEELVDDRVDGRVSEVPVADVHQPLPGRDADSDRGAGGSHCTSLRIGMHMSAAREVDA